MKIKDQSGTFLVEAAVSVFLVGFGALAVTQLQSRISGSNTEVNQRAEALRIAQNKVDELRGARNTASYTTLSGSNDTIQGKNSSYTRAWAITSHTNPDYKGVSVTVSWQDRAKKNHSVKLTSQLDQTEVKNSVQLFKTEYVGLTEPTLITDPDTGNTIPSSPPILKTLSPENAPNIKLTYDASTGEIVKINGIQAYSITGEVRRGTGSVKPDDRVDLTNVSLYLHTEGQTVSYCFSNANATHLKYECIVPNTWAGYVVPTNVGNAAVCTNTQQPYSQLSDHLEQQNFLLIKGTKNCPRETSLAYNLN